MLKRAVAIAVLALAATGASAQTLEEEALAWLQGFIRVDTINPPGNETRATEYLSLIHI